TDSVIDSDGFANGGPSHIEGKQKESGFNPKFLIQADVSDEVNIYASASKGFRIGGVNGNIPADAATATTPEGICFSEVQALGLDPSKTKTFDSDTLWSYETGFKSKFAQNRVTLNAAAYLIEWSNISQQNRLACGFQFIANAGAAEIKGFEAELVFAPMDGLTYTLGAGHANAKITDDGGVVGVSVGDRIQGVPNWTFNASGEYIFPLMGEVDGLLRGDWNHYGESFSANNEAANPRRRDPWDEVNLRAGVIKDNWEIALFVDNVTNEHINLADSRSIAAETPGRQRLVTNRPRTIGVDIRTHF
ncbi:MAG TPA: TonB-dependent receptor, partial [Hellea balneolensis]|nr:TonB-dependent receptor [Hellea balneolensis]